MRPEFAAAIDPVFTEVLRFKASLQSQPYVTADVQATILKRIDTAETSVTDAKGWELSKRALCAWIDSQLIDAAWEASDWWENNCLEVHYFGSPRRSYGEFFQWSKEAARLPSKDALEVFYLAVILGFRGCYGDPDPASRAAWIQRLEVPATVEEWCRITSHSLQLGQGRSDAAEIPCVQTSASPLQGRTKLATYAMLGSFFAGLAGGTAIVIFRLLG